MATLKDYLISGKFNGEVSINGMKMTLKDMLISAKLSGDGGGGGHDYIYNWDFTKSMVDSVQHMELTPVGDISRDSGGLHINNAILPGINSHVELTGLNVDGYCFEIDVAKYERQGNDHGRLFTIVQEGVASSGFIFRKTGNWAIYSKKTSSWIESSLPYDGLDGQTVTIKLKPNESNVRYMYVYLNDSLIASGNMDASTTLNAFIGSDNGQAAYIMTITGLRVYQED